VLITGGKTTEAEAEVEALLETEAEVKSLSEAKAEFDTDTDALTLETGKTEATDEAYGLVALSALGDCCVLEECGWLMFCGFLEDCNASNEPRACRACCRLKACAVLCGLEFWSAPLSCNMLESCSRLKIRGTREAGGTFASCALFWVHLAGAHFVRKPLFHLVEKRQMHLRRGWNFQ
jgi:hypothetical protein